MTLDELSPQARALLEAARETDDPSPADRARIDAAFAPKLTAFGIAAVAATGAAAPLGRHSLGTTGKAGLAAVAGVAIWFGIHTLAPAPAFAPKTEHLSFRPQFATPAAPATAADAPPSVTRSVTPEAEKLDQQTRVGARSPAQKLPRAERSAAPRTREDASLPLELGLIARANAELRAQRYAQALALLEEHAARFPNGVLNEERRGLHALAVCALSSNAAAREERARFLREAPGSVLASKVREACAGSQSPAAESGTR